MPKPIPRKPLWRGPDVDGITQSLLGRFLECRERFRLRVVEGITEDEGFSRPLNFGNLWHAAEESRLGGGDWQAALRKYRLHLHRVYPNDETEILKWYHVAKTTFPIYLAYWSRHKDETGAKPILEECSFAVPYQLPSGRMVLLRGKWDALRLLKIGKTSKSAKYGIYIKEHKTKGEIDEEGILKTVGWNLQTMMYQIALRELLNTPANVHNFHDGMDSVRQLCPPTAPPSGVLYNVIRRPLADRYAIKQKKTETIDGFYRRLGEEITADSFNEKGQPKKSTYFMRWRVEVTDEDIQTFKDHTFHPILEQLWDWWEHIQVDPFNPWRLNVDTNTSPHYQAPWGVYNSLAGGFRGSYFDYLTSGREYGLKRIETLFPELA